MRLNTKTVLFALGLALTVAGCGKKRRHDGPGVPPPAPGINNPYVGPYAPGSANDPMLQIANVMQGHYGNIAILNTINYGLVTITPTGPGGISWIQFYQTYVIRAVNNFGGYNNQFGANVGYWGGFNYGGFYQNYQNTFNNWQRAVVYVTGGQATGGQPMNVTIFEVFNTFIGNAYSMYAQYTPYYQSFYPGYYYPQSYCGVWPYYNSFMGGRVFYGGGNWGISIGFSF